MCMNMSVRPHKLSMRMNMSVSMLSGCPCYLALDVYEHVCIHAVRLSVLSGS